jgi:hypothetical protein
MVVSALVIFLYGSMVWGLFPLKEEISWEAHLFGAIAGVLVAYNYRKDGPQPHVYDWEKESENDDPETEQNGLMTDENEFDNADQTPPPFSIHYHFKPKEDKGENNRPDQ